MNNEEQQQLAVAQPKPVAQLTIMLMDNGSITINGPIHDLILCYGLIERGRDALRTYHAKQAKNKSGIQIARSLG